MGAQEPESNTRRTHWDPGLVDMDDSFPETSGPARALLPQNPATARQTVRRLLDRSGHKKKKRKMKIP